MIIKRRLWFHDVIFMTWKIQIALLAVATLPTIVYIEFLRDYVGTSSVVVGVLGTALAFFIGFINNQAYGRWWEARKIWGALVNDSRSFSRMVLSFLSSELGRENDVRQLQVKLVHRQIGFLYALKERLRDAGEDNYKKYLAPGDEERMGEQTHIPNAILLLQGQDIEGAVASQYTDVFRMTQINEMLNGFSDHMGKCERIKNTPFPVAYTTLIRTSIWLFAIVFPASITGVVGYWAIPFGWLLAAIFVLTRAMGEQLMNPFERTMSGTAMSSITRTIEINLLEQLGAEDIPKAVEPIDNLYVL